MAYQEDEYGNTYYVPDTQYGGNRGDWDWGSGLSAAASGAGTGASIGALFGPAGVPLGAIAGGLLGGAYGLFTGTAEQDRARAAEAANVAALAAARKRMEQGFADERSALETQRQMLEAQNPAEALYGTQGRQGLLQAQQAMLAQQMAAQGARNRAALASRGLLGSGMEAATSGALAGQQAGAQAQLQANIAQQYMQQQQAQQQQLAQLGLQQAQVRQRQEAARSAQDLTALQMQQQYAQQIAQRNQALLQAGLQGVSTGVSAGLQANALELAKTQRKEDLDLIRQALKINVPATPAASAMPAVPAAPAVPATPAAPTMPATPAAPAMPAAAAPVPLMMNRGLSPVPGGVPTNMYRADKTVPINRPVDVSPYNLAGPMNRLTPLTGTPDKKSGLGAGLSMAQANYPMYG